MIGEGAVMSFREMTAALNAISPPLGCEVKMRQDRTWYVSVSAEISHDGRFLESPTQAATNPEAAIREAWASYSTAKRVVYRSVNGIRRDVRWNGFMWEDVK